MWNFFKKKKIEPKEKVYVNTLTINLKNNRSFSWNTEVPNDRKKISCWKHFYKWYFCKATPYFIVKYKNGETMLRRENIESFDIRISEEYK